MLKRQQAEINVEFFIQHYCNGIKLIRDNAFNNSSTCYRINDIFYKLPLRCDFSNTEHMVLAESDHSAVFNQKVGIDSFVGLTVFDVSDKTSALLTINNNMNVMKRQQCLIIEEHPIVQNQQHHFLSFKLPWYNQENVINGMFSCSIPIGHQSFAEALPIIASLGLLSPQQYSAKTAYQPVLQGRFIKNIYFTPREIECLQYLMLGKSAKLIARILNLSPRTVEGYIENIKNKSGAVSKYDLIEKFIGYL